MSVSQDDQGRHGASDGSTNGPICPECGRKFYLTEHSHLENSTWNNVGCCGKLFRVEKKTIVRWIVSPNDQAQARSDIVFEQHYHDCKCLKTGTLLDCDCDKEGRL